MPVTFGIQDALIAPRTAPGVYGDGIDVPFIQMMGATVRTLSAEGPGDDKIAVVASRKIAGSVQVRLLGADLDVLAIIYGETIIETGADDTLIRTLPITAGGRYPWFGIVGLGLEEEETGDVLLYATKCKITSDVTLGAMEYGALSTVEFTATCLGEAGYPIFSYAHRATTGEFDLPPAGIEEP